MIISISPIKGGVSKSTLAVHLAAWAVEKGYSTLLVDCDPQASSSSWMQAVAPAVEIAHLVEADAIFDQLPKLGERADIVIADGPGNNSEVSRALLSWADLAVLPCKAGQLELDSIDQTMRVLQQVRKLRGGLPEAVVVLTQVQDRFLLTQAMRKYLKGYKVPVAKKVMAYRQIYADAPGQGKVVWQMEEDDPRAASAAKLEINAIFNEVLPSKKSKRRSWLPARRSGRRPSTTVSAR